MWVNSIGKNTLKKCVRLYMYALKHIVTVIFLRLLFLSLLYSSSDLFEWSVSRRASDELKKALVQNLIIIDIYCCKDEMIPKLL